MTEARVSLLVLCLLGWTSLASAQDVDEHDLTSHVADIRGGFPGGGGLMRLSLPPEVLALTASDLSDVRVVSEYGSDLPYVVDREDHVVRTVAEESRVPIVPTSASQTRTRSVAAVVFREVYEVVVPPREGDIGETHLELAIDAADFTATVRVSGVGVDVSATVFRLPSMGVERLHVPLPSTAVGPLTVSLESETGFLSPRFVVARRAYEMSPVRLERPLSIVSTRMEGTTQVVELTRPAGLLPMVLRVGTSSTTFASEVVASVRSADAGTVELGRGRVYRIPPRAEGGPVAESLEVGVDGSVPGELIELRFSRGDSPALTDLTVTAVLSEVALVFESQFRSTLHFGGARLRRPSFDLSALSASLSDPSLPLGTLEGLRPNPDYQHDPVLGFAMRAGAAVDRSTFSHAAGVTLAEAPEGLTRIELTPAFLAVAGMAMSDVRLLSEDGLQWPYVVARDVRDVVVSVPVTLSEDRSRPGWSRYALRVPFAMAPTRMAVDPEEAFFSRTFALHGSIEGSPSGSEPIILLEMRGERDGEGRAPVELFLSGQRFTELSLLVEDGDEAPLTLTEVTVHLDVHDLLVTAPAGTYELVVGDPLAEAPTYDLSRVSEDVLSNVAIATATLGEVHANPAFHEPTFLERSGWQSLVLWAVLIVSVLVLLVLTLRLARNEPEAPAAQPAAPPPSPAANAAPAPASDAEGRDAASDAEGDDAPGQEPKEDEE
jgi:hypothetical protein